MVNRIFPPCFGEYGLSSSGRSYVAGQPLLQYSAIEQQTKSRFWRDKNSFSHLSVTGRALVTAARQAATSA